MITTSISSIMLCVLYKHTVYITQTCDYRQKGFIINQFKDFQSWGALSRVQVRQSFYLAVIALQQLPYRLQKVPKHCM